MRIAFLIAWVCFAIVLLLVAYLLITKNAGDDAAGRGLASGYGIILLIFALASGTLLFWGQNSSSKAFQWFTLLVIAIPFLAAGGLWANNLITNARESVQAAYFREFDDPRLAAIAHAIDRGDLRELKLLLQERGSIDWQARSRSDVTLLGYAIQADVVADFNGDHAMQFVPILLAHGAPPTGDPTYSGKPLLSYIIEGNTPGSLTLLRMLLEAGADPNVPDGDGLPLIHHLTNSAQSAAKAEMLVEYGADLQARNNRVDRPEWSALMNAAYMQDWDLALYFLNHGIPPDYIAPDGNSLASILVECAALDVTYQRSPAPGYIAMQAALQAKESD